MKNSTIKLQTWILIAAFLLMGIKLIAWYFSGSNAILTDALESIVNILAAAFTLYSLYLSVKPKDKEHPYGHGKIEYIAAGIEGGLIGITGIMMIIKASTEFDQATTLTNLDLGIILSVMAGIVNYMMGFYMIRRGKKLRSVSMVAGGKHLQSDGYTSAGMIIGLVVIYLTEKYWVDNLIAIILGLILIFSCVAILRKSVAGIMDETDHETVNEVIEVLKSNRRLQWIDIHNLRIIKYGASLHIDCHVTLPWYLNLQEAHEEMDEMQRVVETNFNTAVEFFIHNDPCLPESCRLCKIMDCKHRKFNFEKEVEWNTENLLTNRKHSIR